MKWRIVTRIEEYCDDDSCFQDLTLKTNGAEQRLLVLKGGQVDKEIHEYAPAEQGGQKELAAAPGDQGAIEAMASQRAEAPTTSPSSTKDDVTIQPSKSRLTSVKSWFANLSKSMYAEFVKQLLPLAVKTVLRMFGIWI